jgi:hypothetical protein
MQEIKPFQTLTALKKALDNGGRFYNFFAAANDEKVTRAELAKAAGVFTAGITAFLYLEMTKQDLSEQDQATALSLLEPKLRGSFEKKKPPQVSPSMVDKNHKAGESVIVTGFARELERKKMFKGFIMVPIMIGKVMIPMMIPIHDLYSVIEIFDNEKMKSPAAIVCTPAKKKIDLSGRVQFGGVLKELRNQTKEPPTSPLFLEAIFWMKR